MNLARSGPHAPSPGLARRLRAVARIGAAALCALPLAARAMGPPRDVGPGRAFLETSWQAYTQLYLHAEGYVFDPTRREVTSEGQSYLLLRAAWMKDRAAFDRALAWTEAHLRREDGLYAWRWQPGTGVTDWNTATDADQDIAFALLLGAHHFARPELVARARELAVAIRLQTGITVGSGWLPSAGNWATTNRIVNLSYFAPYAYAYFDRLDPAGRWPSAIETGYDLLRRVRALPGVVLPPDFAVVGEDGAMAPVPAGGVLSGDFSFDAMRVYWRIAMDLALRGAREARPDPAGVRDLARLFARDGAVFTRYRLDGTPLTDQQSWSFYGSLLTAFRVYAPEAAAELCARKLTPRQLDPIVRSRDRYYDLNWLWFGVAGAEGFLAERTPRPAAIRVPPPRPDVQATRDGSQKEAGPGVAGYRSPL